MLKKHPLMTYALAIFLCLGLGMLSGLLTKGELQWYHTLHHPSFSPPDWIFQPVWTVLYIFMGVVLARFFLHRTQGLIWLLFMTQLMLNFFWTPIFFYYHQIGLALVDISLLSINVAILMWLNRREPLLFYLLLPYELWLIFALILNTSLFILNASS